MDLYEIRMKFPGEKLHDVRKSVRQAMLRNPMLRTMPPRSPIAITAGSRGIANMQDIYREIVDQLRSYSLSPFLVPAMGSHGGATAEGQIEVLRHLGITEETVGAPIRSSMEVDFLGHTPGGLPVYLDRHAARAAGIIVVNRIKAHTAFRGKIEGGLSKMIAIGLGKMTGASFIHGAGVSNMAKNIEEISNIALKRAPILLGIGILENGYEETTDIIGVLPEEWHEKEAELLLRSKRLLPSLPVESIDLLIVEEMGKAFSGSGMDPNILGRWRIAGVPEPASPSIKRIVVLDLAHNSNGNAQGIGLADFTTQALVDKIDRIVTYTSTITSTFLQRGMLPMTFPTEREAIEAAIRSLGPEQDPAMVKLVQIPNTLHLDQVLVSSAVLRELERSGKNFERGGKTTLSFDPQGRIVRRLSRNR